MLFESFFDKNHPRYYKTSDYRVNGDISVVEIGYNRVPEGLSQTLKREVFILHYIVDGKGEFLGEKFNSRNGYLVVPNQLEVIEADKKFPYECYWIMFKGRWAERILNLCGLENNNCVFSFNRTKECADIIKKALFEKETTNFLEEAALLQSVFYKIIAVHLKDIDSLPFKSENVTEQIKNFLNNNYSERVEISQLARRLGYTRNYVYALFKKEYGISPMEYLVNLRIEKAKQLLRDKNENLSVGQIAYATGFNDPLYFSRIFRQKTSLTPSQFRKNSDK